jgi:hypothetical protein
MATETTKTTAALILATFALVGFMTTGTVVPAAFAQSDVGGALTNTGLLGQFLNQDIQKDGKYCDCTSPHTCDCTSTPTCDCTSPNTRDCSSCSNGGSITDGLESTRETTEQTEDQSEQNTQTNAISQEQTANNNHEIASGSGSEVASAANSESDSDYKIKDKSKDDKDKSKDDKDKSKDDKDKSRHGGSSNPILGESTTASYSASGVSTNGDIEQNQTLDSPTLVNTNDAGTDESRSAVVGFDLGFEQFTN